MTMIPEEAWAVRARIYQGLAATGRCPTVNELAADAGLPVERTEALLGRLADAHVLALHPESGEVWMAHPFSAVPTDCPVQAGGVDYWANCAWDAIAIPMLLVSDGGGELVCPATGTSTSFRVSGGFLEPVPGVIRFPVPPRLFWDDIGFT